ncbi:MAG: enoyl-CoA hydratase-related protein, partial [Spongiibacter sp.]
MNDAVVISRDGAVATLTLNRPEKRNALDLSLRAAIAEGMRELSADDSVAAIVITGGDQVFA